MTSPEETGLPSLFTVAISVDERLNESEKRCCFGMVARMRGPAVLQADVGALFPLGAALEGASDGKASWEVVSMAPLDCSRGGVPEEAGAGSWGSTPCIFYVMSVFSMISVSIVDCHTWRYAAETDISRGVNGCPRSTKPLTG